METAWKCTRVQACVQFVHSMCTNLDTPCTLKLLLGHPLYVHWSCIHACTQAWAHVYISKQFPSLGTPTFTAVFLAFYFTTRKSTATKFKRSPMYIALITSNSISKCTQFKLTKSLFLTIVWWTDNSVLWKSYRDSLIPVYTTDRTVYTQTSFFGLC